LDVFTIKCGLEDLGLAHARWYLHFQVDWFFIDAVMCGTVKVGENECDNNFAPARGGLK